MNIDEHVKKLASSVFAVEKITETDNLADMGDSLDMIELIAGVNKFFGIEIVDSEIDRLVTVQDLIDCVTKIRERHET